MSKKIIVEFKENVTSECIAEVCKAIAMFSDVDEISMCKEPQSAKSKYMDDFTGYNTQD